MWKRAATILVIVFSLFVLPWWVAFSLSLVAAFFFRRFVEFVVVGLALDALYGSAVAGVQFPYFFTLLTLLALGIISVLKKRLIMY